MPAQCQADGGRVVVVQAGPDDVGGQRRARPQYRADDPEVDGRGRREQLLAVVYQKLQRVPPDHHQRVRRAIAVLLLQVRGDGLGVGGAGEAGLVEELLEELDRTGRGHRRLQRLLGLEGRGDESTVGEEEEDPPRGCRRVGRSAGGMLWENGNSARERDGESHQRPPCLGQRRADRQAAWSTNARTPPERKKPDLTESMEPGRILSRSRWRCALEQ